jgi:hypothetical protein
LDEWLVGFGDQFEWFGDQIGAQIEALTEQFAAMGGANRHRYQLNLCFMEEDDEFSV